ncbi:restriction endonuclease subunit S [Vibrio alginolyticus]|uniref:restriction endonuclease subunit S n=1 Tax=Vibrio alginolyticus TaxID=663 RepID=UPI0021CF33A4|nr:restriction endonuclease subunit S [Vibrio alginolyticus]MDA0420251.1 restriction endonuclease subunit S [Vibrio alginolyticus]
MTGRYKAYSEYKESGIDWIGVIPVSWSCLPIKRSFEVVNGSTPRSGEKLYWDGDITWVTPADLSKVNESISTSSKTITNEGLSSCGTSLVPKGSLILSTRAPIGTIAIASKELCTNQGCKSLIKTTSVENKYVYYVLSISGKQLNNLGRGTTFLELSTDELANYRVPNPSIQEQQKIANFLDHETAKIDTLIAKQEKLIELLKEKRQAVISHAVTKGLNPDAPMKDSGVEWLGDVPEHWEVLPTKRFFRLVAEPSTKNHGKELLSVYAAIGVAPRKDLEQKGNKASNTDGYWSVKKGDIIVNKLLAWMGAVGYSDYDGVTSPAYDILRKTKDINPKFYHFLFRQEFTQSEFKRWSRGIMEMRLRLYFEELGRIMMPVPPKNEQDKIVAEIESMNATFVKIEDKATKQIELMKERKTALISAAVTGKIDVRDWQESA